MPKLIFDTCCGCIELKTGCFILAYMELVFEIIFGVILLLILVAGTVAVSMSTGNDDEAREMGAGLLAMGIILMLFLALLLAFTISLLVGLHQNKRGHIKAYLIYSAIFLVLGEIMFLASSLSHISFADIISNFICLHIHMYFFLVIRSYYYKMDDATIYNTA